MLSLKTILRMNAASCLGFGALFVIFPSAVAAFLSASPAPSWLILGIGAMLIMNGAHLIWTSAKALPAKAEILYFSSGDFAWVIGTLALVLNGTWVTSTPGVAVALAIATMVAFFGVSQMFARKRMGAC